MTRIIIPVIKSSRGFVVSPHFGRASAFAVVEVTNDEYRVVEIVDNKFREHEHGKGLGVISLVLSRKPDIVIAGGMGPRAFTSLSESGVKIYLTPQPGIELDKVINLYLQGGLNEATEEYISYHEDHH